MPSRLLGSAVDSVGFSVGKWQNLRYVHRILGMDSHAKSRA